MRDDHELLRRYAEEGAEEAFTELVQRHINLVHSAALRQVNGDAHLAADATQLVFTHLARKARGLAGHRVLAGWLYTSARYAAGNLVRSERRRRIREEEARQMETLNDGDQAAALDWRRVRPVLDDAMNALARTDREAVLLRFFEGRDYGEVGARLNVSANAARMRVERALDRLRHLLERRGVASTSAALAAALGAQAVTAAPAGLAAAVSSTALAGGVASGTLAVFLMSIGKLQVGVTGALLVAGAAGLVVQGVDLGRMRTEIAALTRQNQEVARLRAENNQLARLAVEAADLRRDDAQLAQLRDEAAALQARLKAQAVEQEKAARTAAEAPLIGEVFDLARLDRTPVPRFQARPQYPAELRTAGIGGEAVVDFVVDAEGAVRQAKAVRSRVGGAREGDGAEAKRFIVQGTGAPGASLAVPEAAAKLEAAAVEAVSKWKFAPGEKDGLKVNARLQVPIVFTVGEKGQAPAPTLWF